MKQYFWQRRYLYLIVANLFWGLYLCYPKNFFLVSLSPFIVAEIMNYIGAIRREKKKKGAEQSGMLLAERKDANLAQLLAAITKIDELKLPVATEANSNELRELLINDYRFYELRQLLTNEIAYNEIMAQTDSKIISNKLQQQRAAQWARWKGFIIFLLVTIVSLLLTWFLVNYYLTLTNN